MNTIDFIIIAVSLIAVLLVSYNSIKTIIGVRKNSIKEYKFEKERRKEKIGLWNGKD